jgi:hypothetical protein
MKKFILERSYEELVTELTDRVDKLHGIAHSDTPDYAEIAELGHQLNYIGYRLDVLEKFGYDSNSDRS